MTEAPVLCPALLLKCQVLRAAAGLVRWSQDGRVLFLANILLYGTASSPTGFFEPGGEQNFQSGIWHKNVIMVANAQGFMLTANKLETFQTRSSRIPLHSIRACRHGQIGSTGAALNGVSFGTGFAFLRPVPRDGV
jgi:hypothetical protein